MTERKLDAQAVEASEFERKNGMVLRAAEAAAVGLGLTSSPLASGEVSEISQDPEQRAVLACLARIYVDSLKTVANQAKLPALVIPPLEEAADIINLVYRNPALNSALRYVDTDHRGRRHDFLAEMARDEAKTFFASSVLYGRSKSEELISLGEKVLRRTYMALPEGHPTKPLIGIELELARAANGLKPKPELKVMRADFEELINSDPRPDDNRIATVASWLVVWGNDMKDERTKQLGLGVFKGIIAKHPEWGFMIKSEHEKISKQRLRRIIFRVLTPLTTDPWSRKNLYKTLKGKSTI